MRKITLANTLAGVKIAVAASIILATAYTAAAFIWMQNGIVVKFDGYEVQTTFWNLTPNYLSTGEAGNALSLGFAMVAAAILLAFALRWVAKKSWRTMRVMTLRLVAPRSKR